MANLMDQWIRKTPTAKTWGSSRISNCDHNIICKNDINYCTHCGRNFKNDELSPNQQFDKIIDSIMPQIADELDPKKEQKKNPFTYEGELK